MENSENQIALIQNVLLGSNIFNIYVTDKRIAFIFLRQLNSGGGLVGALITEGVRWAHDSRKELANVLTLDELLKKNRLSYAFFYKDLKHFRVYDNREIEVVSLAFRRTIKLPKEAYAQLLTTLPTISLLEGKLELHAKKKPFTKDCVQCGKDIPLASEECGYCGIKQPTSS